MKKINNLFLGERVLCIEVHTVFLSQNEEILIIMNVPKLITIVYMILLSMGSTRPIDNTDVPTSCAHLASIGSVVNVSNT